MTKSKHTKFDPAALLQEFVLIPAPPGQERPLREVLVTHVKALGLNPTEDAKGNLLVALGDGKGTPIVITAHMDEIAMIVRRVMPDGSITVGPLGGLFPWKLGEGPVQLLGRTKTVDGVLGFGSIHTADKSSTVRKADNAPIDWDMAKILTGLTLKELSKAGIRPGTRVVVHPSRRQLTKLGELVGGYFLDDRADLVSWLIALEALKDTKANIVFAATAAEEVGGEGAKFILRNLKPDICVALELGPNVEDAPVELTDQPTVWTADSYSSMSAEDGFLLDKIGEELKMDLQFQSLSRGGSDASASANQGLCARCFTLALPMANSHGCEVMHPGAMENLARLTVALVEAL
ncbi:MAG TPA: M20/M25/M40 family metallo-hydrolase [Fimbriimonadaceae bacterium]|jgi:putative aminopeptidase FrvX